MYPGLWGGRAGGWEVACFFWCVRSVTVGAERTRGAYVLVDTPTRWKRLISNSIHFSTLSPFRPTVFLGDQGVGKTSIITRFMYDSFEKNYQVSKAG